MWSATLGYSRRRIYIRSNTITTDDFVGCAYQTAQRLGGVPPEWLTDNVSALVTIDSGGKRHGVERAFAFAGRMGFRIEPCGARTPQTKGKDESANRFVNWLLAHGRDVGSWEDIDAAMARMEARSSEESNEGLWRSRIVAICCSRGFLMREERDRFENPASPRAIVSSLGDGLATWPLVPSPLMTAAEWAQAWRLSRTPHLTLWHTRPQRGPLCRPPPPCNRFSWATVSPG